MTHTYPELLGIRMYALETKQHLSNLYGMLASNGLLDSVYIDIETLQHNFDDAGRLCDEVWETCDWEIKRMVERKERVKAGEVIYEPRSRWEL